MVTLTQRAILAECNGLAGRPAGGHAGFTAFADAGPKNAVVSKSWEDWKSKHRPVASYVGHYVNLSGLTETGLT